MQKKPLLASCSVCTGCLACIDVCPKKAISKYVGDDGHLYVKINESICIGCLKCQNLCESIHSVEYSNNEKISVPYSVYTNNEVDYQNATSGGVFSAIAKYIIEQGGVVYGAAYIDGFNVAHIGVSSFDKIVKLQGSKYIQSDLEGTFKSIEKDISEGRFVLFTGTGCQVAALLAFFKSHKNRRLLFSMDVVCGGVPSSLLLKSFINFAAPKPKSIAYFRKKEKYSFAYNSVTDHLILCTKSLPLDGFKSLLTSRYSCYDCKFTGIHRTSDWTIGDLWGDNDKNKCKSLCICHNDRASTILKSVDVVATELSGWNFAIHNPRLINGRCKFEKRLERRFLGYFFKQFDYKTLCKIYAADIKKYDVLWMLYKTYRYLRFTMYFKKSKSIVKKIIS